MKERDKHINNCLLHLIFFKIITLFVYLILAEIVLYIEQLVGQYI